MQDCLSKIFVVIKLGAGDEPYELREKLRKVMKGQRERGEEISGELIIADFPRLEKIDVGYNKLTQLHPNNCPQLTKLECSNNKLTELIITNCPNLQKICADNNQLTNLDLRVNTALTTL